MDEKLDYYNEQEIEKILRSKEKRDFFFCSKIPEK